MRDGGFTATYLIETPLEPARSRTCSRGASRAAAPSCAWPARATALRARAARVERIDELEPLAAPSLPNALLERQGRKGPWRRARIRVAFPAANVGANLPTLAATVAGNPTTFGETTGVRLEALELAPAFRARFERPRQGIAGTRRATGVASGPLWHDHQAQRRSVGRGNWCARRRAVCRRVWTSSRTTSAAAIRSTRRRRAHPRRHAPCARTPGQDRQARHGGVQHHRRARRHAASRGPGRGRRRQLRDGESHWSASRRCRRCAGTPTSRCTGIATASACSRAIRRSASTSSPTRCCGVCGGRPHARARRASSRSPTTK